MSDTQHKPCPFCGGTDLATPPLGRVVVCGDCRCAGPFVEHPHPRRPELTQALAYQKWDVRQVAADVGKLPKTADGAIVGIGDVVWVCTYHDGIQEDAVAPPVAAEYDAHAISDCYSTREAAEQGAPK